MGSVPHFPLKIGIKETSLQEQVRFVGGRWNKTQRGLVCTIYGFIAGTKLEKLIVVETTEKAANMDSL